MDSTKGSGGEACLPPRARGRAESDGAGASGTNNRDRKTGSRGARTRRRCLQALERFGPQVVLCDIGLPGMDGYAVARHLRAGRPAKTPTLVALIGYGSPEDHERSRAAGFDPHIIKPAYPEALLRLIDSVMYGTDLDERSRDRAAYKSG